MHYPSHLQKKRGASLVEFLVLAPLLVFMGLMAYDLNRRVEEDQRVTVMAFNNLQVQQGYTAQKVNQRNLNQLHDSATASTAGVVRDPEEFRQLQQIRPNLQNQYGVSIAIEDKASVPTHLLGQPSNVRIQDGQGTTSSLNTVAKAQGFLTEKSSSVVNTLQDTAYAAGLLIQDKLRVATVSTHSEGEKNFLQKTMSILAEATENNAQAEDDILNIERRFAHRTYIRPEDGYHPSAYRNSGLYAMGLSLLLDTKPWGYEGKFARHARSLQDRCMTRFMSDNSCDTKNKFSFEGPRSGSFPSKTRTLAWAKFAYSTIATLGSWVPVAGQAAKGADEAISAAGRAIIGMMTGKLERVIKEDLISTMQSKMQSYAQTSKDQIKNTGVTLLNDMTTHLDPQSNLKPSGEAFP